MPSPETRGYLRPLGSRVVNSPTHRVSAFYQRVGRPLFAASAALSSARALLSWPSRP